MIFMLSGIIEDRQKLCNIILEWKKDLKLSVSEICVMPSSMPTNMWNWSQEGEEQGKVFGKSI